MRNHQRQTHLKPQDLLKAGKPYAITDTIIVVARSHTIQPPEQAREVEAVQLLAFRATGLGFYDAIGRIRPMPFNARVSTIGHEAKLWAEELIAESLEVEAA